MSRRTKALWDGDIIMIVCDDVIITSCVNVASPVVGHWWSGFIVCLGIGRVEDLIGKVIDCYVEVTSLNYGHDIANGVLG